MPRKLTKRDLSLLKFVSSGFLGTYLEGADWDRAQKLLEQGLLRQGHKFNLFHRTEAGTVALKEDRGRRNP